MGVPHPEFPAIPEYPTPQHGGPYSELLEKTKANFLEVIEKGSEYWEEQGERDGVALARHIDPQDTWAVPAVRGVCTVEEATTDDVLAVVQLPGMRKKWDPRFEGGHMLARYDRISYLFYSSMYGMGWLVYPRTIVGVQANYRPAELNHEIIVIQVSAPDNGSYAEYPGDEYGKVRATVRWSGWKLTPKGNDVEIKYGVNISLEGSIPTAMVSMVATEIPTCTGRVRDVFYEHGFPPWISPPPAQADSPVVFQTESFDFDKKTWRATVSGGSTSGSFIVHYDSKRLYSTGVQVKIEGDGKADVEAKDDGKGIVEVQVGEGAKGKGFFVVVSPR